ncbi:MAG: hypothetical protein KC964_22710, partial [Candidatus Omnitrophica bacterium]|nr:hypothetical protein [Candidatus Omnitrophota bacterium]
MRARTVFLTFLFAVGSLTCNCSGLQAQDQKILETLTAYDQAFFSNFTLTAKATFPTTAFDTSQGDCTSIVRISGNGSELAMARSQISMTPPRFSPDRVKREYDERGDYELNLTKDLYVYLGPDRWKTRIDQERRMITPASEVVETQVGAPVFDIRPVGHPDPKNQIFRYLLPLGRGFSDLMETVLSSEKTKDGFIKVYATGSLFSPRTGIWEVNIDPESEFLVQSATFTVDGSDNQHFMFHDVVSGSVLDKSDLPLWKAGTFYLASNYKISIELSSTSNRADDHL